MAFQQVGQKQPSSSRKNAPAVDLFLSPESGPLSLPKVLDLLHLVQQDIETEGRIMKAVDARGVDFAMTADDSRRLADAGASVKLLELLRRKAPPAPPVPATPPGRTVEEPKGVLRLQCEPAECEVAVDGGPYVSTRNGSALVQGLQLGKSVANFRKSGYFSQQLAVEIERDPGKMLTVKLEPDYETRLAFGKQLFDSLLTASGYDPNAPMPLVASGSATVFDTAGSGTEWNITVGFEVDRHTFDVKNSNGAMRLDCRSETCQAQPGGRLFSRRLSRDQGQNLETNLRQFQKYQFASFLHHLASKGTRALANTGKSPQVEGRLRLENDNEAFDITLNTELLPTLITLESKTGVGSGMSVAFADYTAVGKLRYPRTTEIKFPDGKQGIRVHFDQLSPGK